MNRCMRITCAVHKDQKHVHALVQDYAQKFLLEGMVQPVTQSTVRVIVCGAAQAVEEFIDELHNSFVATQVAEIEVEPFLKDRDYRGVFRVIE